MGGVVFVISAKYAEHWNRAVAAGFWETARRVPVEQNDLLVFWLAQRKRFLGLAQAVAPVEPADYGTVARPWLESDPSIYHHRYRFELIDSTGDEAMTWPGLMTLVGQKATRGANTAPVLFDDSGAFALAKHLVVGGGKVKPAPPPSPPPKLLPGSPVGKPFVKRVDYAAPAIATISVHDPDVWGTGLAAHRQTENGIAEALHQKDLKPQDPIVGGPNFDLAWHVADTLVVCEVKSITPANERVQIRLGLGQVLDYAFTLRTAGHSVEPWLVVDHEPSSPHWAELCAANDVTLSWPDALDDHLDVVIEDSTDLSVPAAPDTQDG